MKVKVQKIKKRKGPGRPPKYVVYKGKIVEGLSFKPGTKIKPDGRFYSSHNNHEGKRVYFGKDLAMAVKKFHRWKRKQKGLK